MPIAKIKLLKDVTATLSIPRAVLTQQMVKKFNIVANEYSQKQKKEGVILDVVYPTSGAIEGVDYIVIEKPEQYIKSLVDMKEMEQDDAIANLQKSINVLSTDNGLLIKENNSVREVNLALSNNNASLEKSNKDKDFDIQILKDDLEKANAENIKLQTMLNDSGLFEDEPSTDASKKSKK